MPPPFHGTGTKEPKRTTPVSGSSLEIENLEDGGGGEIVGGNGTLREKRKRQ